MGIGKDFYRVGTPWTCMGTFLCMGTFKCRDITKDIIRLRLGTGESEEGGGGGRLKGWRRRV